MAFRMFEDSKLGPHIAGEPNAKQIATGTVRDCLGGDWKPKDERSAQVNAADESVEKKLADKATKPEGAYANAVSAPKPKPAKAEHHAPAHRGR